MLLAARQAVRVSQAGMSSAEYTTEYLATLAEGGVETGFLAALKGMTWGQIAEGTLTNLATAGIGLGMNFLVVG